MSLVIALVEALCKKWSEATIHVGQDPHMLVVFGEKRIVLRVSWVVRNVAEVLIDDSVLF